MIRKLSRITPSSQSSTEVKTALQTIQRLPNRSGQNIVYNTLKLIENLKACKIEVRFQWVPGRHSIPGNEIAYQLAKEIAGSNQDHHFGKLITKYRLINQENMLTEWRQE